MGNNCPTKTLKFYTTYGEKNMTLKQYYIGKNKKWCIDTNDFVSLINMCDHIDVNILKIEFNKIYVEFLDNGHIVSNKLGDYMYRCKYVYLSDITINLVANVLDELNTIERINNPGSINSLANNQNATHISGEN
jgi:hypothetical protein